MFRCACVLLAVALVPAAVADPPEPVKYPTSWANAKVGDVMKYQLPNNLQQTYEVSKVDEQFAYVKMTMVIPAAPVAIPPTTQKFPRYTTVKPVPPKPNPDVQFKQLPDQDVTVSGQTLHCKVAQTIMKIGERTITSTVWHCAQVPGGLVKSQSDAAGTMQITQQLVELKLAPR